MRRDYYSENWYQATEKFCQNAVKCGQLRWCVAPGHKFDITYVSIGTGPHKVVINSGVHGIEGYFGSAAQLLFLDKIVPNLSPELLKKYTFVLIHIINGWGMQNRMREVRDKKHGGLVDLNRNFGVDFSRPDALPQNPKYELAHDLLLSKPDKVVKKNALKEFRAVHLDEGVWDAISYGQYTQPYGLFYGGSTPMIENLMTMSIYDEIMHDADSLISIGMHTGLGRFYRKSGRVTSQMLVSHPGAHKNTRFFAGLTPNTTIVPDEKAVNGPSLLGDLVDCLENRYATSNRPVYTADFEVGTGEFPIMSPIYKRMDMGDARYDLLNYGEINPQTWKNLTESWYPSDVRWRNAALKNVNVLFHDMTNRLSR
ncbi:MAG: DUF2817 domain-containing protein [Alphaproteobacteria bacterium]|nr:DUF2817 domain-containing protein [Alphaproteobacteria bacterium]